MMVYLILPVFSDVEGGHHAQALTLLKCRNQKKIRQNLRMTSTMASWNLSGGKCPGRSTEGGLIPVISRIISPVVGVIIPATHL